MIEHDTYRDGEREGDDEYEKALDAIEQMRSELKRQNYERFKAEMTPFIVMLIVILIVLFLLFTRR